MKNPEKIEKLNDKEEEIDQPYVGIIPDQSFDITIESLSNYIDSNRELEKKVDELMHIIENNNLSIDEINSRFNALLPHFLRVNDLWLYLKYQRWKEEIKLKNIKKRGRRKIEKLTDEQIKLRDLENTFWEEHIRVAVKFWSIWEIIFREKGISEENIHRIFSNLGNRVSNE
ncbi:MAG: hypothetical protein NZ822_02410 [Patescibacteria group bacterium]|nr:hypothetical protein [Patescibacteria group bacterium]